MNYGKCRCGVLTSRHGGFPYPGIWECGPCSNHDQEYRLHKEEYEAATRAELEADPVYAEQLLTHLRTDPTTAAFRMRIFGKE